MTIRLCKHGAWMGSEPCGSCSESSIKVLERGADLGEKVYRERCTFCESLLEFKGKDARNKQDIMWSYKEIDCPVCGSHVSATVKSNLTMGDEASTRREAYVNLEGGGVTVSGHIVPVPVGMTPSEFAGHMRGLYRELEDE